MSCAGAEHSEGDNSATTGVSKTTTTQVCSTRRAKTCSVVVTRRQFACQGGASTTRDKATSRDKPQTSRMPEEKLTRIDETLPLRQLFPSAKLTAEPWLILAYAWHHNRGVRRPRDHARACKKLTAKMLCTYAHLLGARPSLEGVESGRTAAV